MPGGMVQEPGDTALPPRSWYHVVWWWEARRPLYNLVLGLVGAGSLVVFLLIDTWPPRAPNTDFEYLFAAVGGAILANVCYTGGWAVELLVRSVMGARVARFGPRAWRVGMGFSLAILLLPTLLNAGAWLTRVLAGS